MPSRCVLEEDNGQTGRQLLVVRPGNDSGTQQTRDHLFKRCYKWKKQQAAMWARAKEESKKGKQKWRVGDLLADGRRSPAVLDSLRVGRAAPPVGEIGIVRALRRNQRGGGRGRCYRARSWELAHRGGTADRVGLK